MEGAGQTKAQGRRTQAMLTNIKRVSNAKSLLQDSEGILSANSSWPTSQSRGEEIHLLEKLQSHKAKNIERKIDKK